MGRVSAQELEEKVFDNYLAIFEGEEYRYHAVSVRQAWFMAFEHFGDECIDELYEVDSTGAIVDVLLERGD